MDSENLQQLGIPIQCGEIHQLRDDGVRYVGDVLSGQIPLQPAVDRAQKKVPRPGLPPRVGQMVQQPAHELRGKYWRQRKSSLRAEPVGTAILGHLGNVLGCSRVLPDQRVVQRFSAAIPNRRRRHLRGDAHRSQIRRGQPRNGESLGDDLLSVGPDLRRIVLGPSGLWENLPVFFLCAGHDRAATIEDDETGAGCALVDRTDIPTHPEIPQSSCCLFSAHAVRDIEVSPAPAMQARASSWRGWVECRLTDKSDP